MFPGSGAQASLNISTVLISDLIQTQRGIGSALFGRGGTGERALLPGLSFHAGTHFPYAFCLYSIWQKVGKGNIKGY